MVFIFAFIWSAGANLYDNPKDNSRTKFSQSIKAKLLKLSSGFSFPYEGDVYDYYANWEERSFKPWNELVTEFKYNKDIPYFNLIVPTADTVKFKFMIEKLCGNSNNILVSGETGVGKSVII